MSQVLSHYRVWLRKKGDRFDNAEFYGVDCMDYNAKDAAERTITDPNFKDEWDLDWVELIRDEEE